MFDVDGAIRRWRERQEREISLSPRELDELEDHLRARIDLEMELNAVLAPEQAFAIALRDLGEPLALSREFAKAGKPRWRRWLLAGWAMYGASWFLPVVDAPFFGIIRGYEMLERAGGVTGALLVLFSNLAMVATALVLWRARLSANRWLWRSVGAVGVSSLVWHAGGLVYGSIQRGDMSLLVPPVLAVGFWTWTASYICVAAALRMRAKNGAPAAVRVVDGFANGSSRGRTARCNRGTPAITPDSGARQ